MMSNAANDVTNLIAGLLATATTAADALAAKFTKTALPPRPPATDLVLQEAQIASVKSDVQMVLVCFSPSKLAEQTAALIADYSAIADDLAVWPLTASPWIGLYFKARGVDLDDLTVLIPKALNGVDDPEQTVARQILAAFDGRDVEHKLPELAPPACTIAPWPAGRNEKTSTSMLPSSDGSSVINQTARATSR